MSVAPNLCCDETKNRGRYSRMTVGWHHPLNGHEFEHIQEMMKDREASCAAVPEVAKGWTWLSNWTTTNLQKCSVSRFKIFVFVFLCFTITSCQYRCFCLYFQEMCHYWSPRWIWKIWNREFFIFSTSISPFLDLLLFLWPIMSLLLLKIFSFLLLLCPSLIPGSPNLIPGSIQSLSFSRVMNTAG